MFVSAAGPPQAYRDPWAVNFNERRSALSARDRRVAYFYEFPEAHTFRYRVHNMIEAIDGRPELGVSAAWFNRDDLERGLDFIDRADVLVICRTRYDRRVGQLIARANARRIKVFYDIDDLIFDLRHAHLVADTIGNELQSGEKWDSFCAYIGQLGLTLQHCDAVLTTNAYLAKQVTAFVPEMPIYIIPNFYNRQQASVSTSIFQRKFSLPMQRDGRLHIGYFSGTKTHAKDFAIVVGALDRALARDTSMVLHVVGSLDIPPQLIRHGDRVRSLPLQDFVNLQRLQGEVEIAIAPLQNNLFTNCKSELKFFEAALTGTAVIASPTFSFQSAIIDGQTGFLAAAHRWDDKIGEARAFLDDSGVKYRALATRARTHVEQCYACDLQGRGIVRALFDEENSMLYRNSLKRVDARDVRRSAGPDSAELPPEKFANNPESTRSNTND